MRSNSRWMTCAHTSIALYPTTYRVQVLSSLGKKWFFVRYYPEGALRKTRLERFTQHPVKSKSFQSSIASLNQAFHFCDLHHPNHRCHGNQKYNRILKLLTYISQNHLLIYILSDLWVTFRSQNLELHSTIFHQLSHVRRKFLPLHDFFSHFLMK